MANRFLVWLSAGVLAAGVLASAIGGAGFAVADDAGDGVAAGGTGSGDDGATSSQATDSSPGTETPGTSNSTGKQPGLTGSHTHVKDADGTDTTNAGSGRDTDSTGPIDDAVPEDDEDVAAEGEQADGQSGEEAAAEEKAVADADVTDGSSRHAPSDATVADKTASTFDDARDAEVQGDLRSTAQVVTRGDQPSPEPPPQDTTETSAGDLAPTAATPEQSPAPLRSESAAVRMAMSAVDEDEPAPARPTLINFIGTLAWSVLDFVVKLVDVPPATLPRSSVTAGRSTLEIDCGDGYTAEADWYYPKEGEPEKLIYFQHGFLARAFVYDRTLSELAERNNAIVVAPSITSNYFACDGCSITADPMHAAVARLFDGDRAALVASASAAGFEGTLPRKFVFAGQSAGSMLAAGASGYYYDSDSTSAQEKAEMVGVLLYDGSAANGALGRALEKLPASVPVLQIAGEPAVFNNYGGANQVLTQMRPGQFNGVQLIGGAHSDAFQSSTYFGLVQAFVNLAFGASTPENVEAVQVLSQGWLTDMYAERVYNTATRTGIYGNPGQPAQSVIDFPTDAGLAQGYVLPGPTPAPSVIERFIAAIVHSINSNDFVACSTEPGAETTSSCGAPAQTVI